jgi:hypothetical protein
MLHSQLDMLYFVPGASAQGLLKSATPSDIRLRSPVINRYRIFPLESYLYSPNFCTFSMAL